MKKITALLLALCLAVSMFGCGGNEDTEPTTTPTTTTPTTNFKSYTVSDDVAAASRLNVVATVGSRELTVGELNVCFWMGVYSFLNTYGSYASLYGLDYTKPLDQQGPTGETKSWQEFFIEDTLSAWHVYAAMALKAEQMGIEMPEDLQTDLDGLRDVMKDSANKNKFESVDAMIQAEAGAATTGDDYYNYTLHYYEYLALIRHLEQNTVITQDDIDAYFTKNETTLAQSKITKDSGNVFGVRHILITPEGGTTNTSGVTTYSDAEWEACRQKAEKLMNEWLAGDATDETFASYAKEHSTDPGSASNGGLYEGLNKDTSFVEPFKNWYLEEGRQVGDYGLVKTDYGYHIMYLSSIEAQWINHCRGAILDETINTFVEDAQKEFPMESDNSKIVIGYVNLGSSS